MACNARYSALSTHHGAPCSVPSTHNGLWPICLPIGHGPRHGPEMDAAAGWVAHTHGTSQTHPTHARPWATEGATQPLVHAPWALAREHASRHASWHASGGRVAPKCRSGGAEEERVRRRGGGAREKVLCSRPPPSALHRGLCTEGSAQQALLIGPS